MDESEMQLYKATGTNGFTLYAETSDAVYCEIHYPSGDVGSVQQLGGGWPIERIKAQFNVEPIDSVDVESQLVEAVREIE